MSTKVSDYNRHDQQIWDEELSDFVPHKVFDAHIHLFDPKHFDSTQTPAWGLAELSTLQQWAERLYPGSETHFLTLGTPRPGVDIEPHNAWCIEQVQQDPNSRLNRLVRPSCKVEDIRRDVERAGVVGLKPYRTFAVTGDAKECRIHEFLTHEQLELANELGLWVTMHLSRQDACADLANLDDLEEYTTRRYPNVKWILAHVARSFTYWPIKHGIDRLKDMPNIWYDTSAVSEVMPFVTLFKNASIDRILYGSDGIDATYFRGKYVALGRAWQYLDVETNNIEFPHCDARPLLAIYEQLMCMKHAAEIVGLDQTDIDQMFWKNAARDFGVQFEN